MPNRAIPHRLQWPTCYPNLAKQLCQLCVSNSGTGIPVPHVTSLKIRYNISSAPDVFLADDIIVMMP